MGKTATWVCAMTIMTVGLSACQKEEPPPPPPVRVENPSLGIAIAALAPDFTLVSADGETIELKPAGALEGTVSVVAGEAGIGGVNLVEAVKQHKAEILEKPDGDYKGQAEYVSPMGTTFASRGRYSDAGGTVEERVVLMVHPQGDRTLQVIYRYPAGEDTQERLDALMNGVIAELEGLPSPDAPDAPEEEAVTEDPEPETEP